MEDRDNRELLKAKGNNLIVYVSGLQNPYFMGEDNSKATWTFADIGKLYANKCLSLPLHLNIEEQASSHSTKLLEQLKTEVQEYIRIEFFNTLRSIEYYRRTREQALAEIRGPYKILEPSDDDEEQLLHKVEEKYPFIGIEEIIGSSVRMTPKDRNAELMDAFGIAVRRGARDYISLKRMNNIAKKAHWKVHKEYDLIFLCITQELGKRGFINGKTSNIIINQLREDLEKDGYKEE